jgi:hypothetical protein
MATGPNGRGKTKNQKLIDARKRLTSASGAPMTPQDIAEEMNAFLWAQYQNTEGSPEPTTLDHRYVSSYEAGRHRWPSEQYRAAWRHALRVETDAELGFTPKRQRPGKPKSSAETAVSTARDAVAGTDSGPPGATDSAANTDGVTMNTPTPERPGPPNPVTSRLVDTMMSPNVDGLLAEPLSADVLTGLAHRAWQLRQAARYEELGQLLPGLITQAEAAVDVHDGADEHRAVHAVVHAYNAASSLLRRIGDAQLALLAADRATRAARMVDDPVLVAAAMYRLANVLLGDNRPADAKAIALRAADLTSPGKTSARHGIALWGGLVLTAAVAAARSQSASEAWELLGEARAGGRLLGTDHADLYAIFGPTNVAIHGVQVAVELGNGREAVRRSHVVNPDRLPASLVERRGQFLIDVARGHILEKNDAEAVALLMRAFNIAPQEVRFNAEVRRLTTTMLSRQRPGAVPDLRQLAAAVGITK